MMGQFLLCLALALPLAAQSFQHRRAIIPQGAGPQRLAVDLELLGGARPDFGDLRIRSASGQEIPYVLMPPAKAEASWSTGSMLPLPPTRTTSGFEMDLGRMMRTERLRVEGLRPPFLKRVRLDASGDRKHWVTLVEEGSLFDLPDEDLKLLQLEFPAGEFRYFRLLWDDRSSGRLDLPESASVQLAKADATPPLAYPVAFEPRSSGAGESRFTIHLPAPRMPVQALVLAAAGTGPLLRMAQVSETGNATGTPAAALLGRAELRRAYRDGTMAACLRIPLARPQGKDLELRIENGNNPPLELVGVQTVVAAQPWIYFEAPASQALEASFGDPKLEAPRYDLEALKGSLALARTEQARWGSFQSQATPVQKEMPSPSLDPGPGAAMRLSDFPVQRPIPDAPPGLAALLLDASVLSRNPGFKNLRILDAGGRQVPYLIEQRDEPLAYVLSLPPGKAAGHTSRYGLRLPEPNLPPSQLVLETSARVFRRRIRLLDESEGPPHTVQEVEWIHQDSGDAAPSLVLPLPGLASGTLTLEVEEGDNPPLPLTRASLLLPGWRLRFFHPGQGLRLCYGRELPAPSYDLALQAKELSIQSIRELHLPPMQARSSGATANRIFWIALGGAIVVLLFLLARLLRKPVQDQA